MIELPWVDFQVVVAGYGVDLNFLLWGSLETEHNGGWNERTIWFWAHEDWERKMSACFLEGSYALNRRSSDCVFHRLPSYHDALVLYAKFLHPGSVQLPQQTHDASLLPGAGWTVHQQVREVTTLNLQNKQFKRSVLLPLLTSIRGGGGLRCIFKSSCNVTCFNYVPLIPCKAKL